MAITTKQQRQQRRSEALQLIADGVPPTDTATQLSRTWGCSSSANISTSSAEKPKASEVTERLRGGSKKIAL